MPLSWLRYRRNSGECPVQQRKHTCDHFTSYDKTAYRRLRRSSIRPIFHISWAQTFKRGPWNLSGQETQDLTLSEHGSGHRSWHESWHGPWHGSGSWHGSGHGSWQGSQVKCMYSSSPVTLTQTNCWTVAYDGTPRRLDNLFGSRF